MNTKYWMIIVTLLLIIIFLLACLFVASDNSIIEFIKGEPILSSLFIGILCSWGIGLSFFFFQKSDSQKEQKELFQDFIQKQEHSLEKTERNLINNTQQEQGKHENVCFSLQDKRCERILGFLHFDEQKDKAGIIAFYYSRLQSPAKIAILNAFAECISKGKKETGTVSILGATLMAFTQPGAMYYPNQQALDEIYDQIPPEIAPSSEVLSGCENIETVEHTNLLVRLLKATDMSIDIIVLNPYCLETYFRAHAEKQNSNVSFISIDEYKQSCLFRDLCRTINFVKDIQSKFPNQVNLKLSFFSNAIFLLMFPKYCFTQQYIMDDKNAQGTTSSIPLIQYSNEKNRGRRSVYSRMESHFAFMWKRAKVLDTLNDYGKGTHADYMFDMYQNLNK